MKSARKKNIQNKLEDITNNNNNNNSPIIMAAYPYISGMRIQRNDNLIHIKKRVNFTSVSGVKQIACKQDSQPPTHQ